MGKSAIIYMGTGCNRLTMASPVKKILQQNGFTKILIRCWTTSRNPVAFQDVKRWNVSSGTFDLVVGHSAGGFPMGLTKTTSRGRKISINPYITQYPFSHRVFHAKDDWLVQQDLGIFDNVILYRGDHNTVPKFELKDYIDEFIN